VHKFGEIELCKLAVSIRIASTVGLYCCYCCCN